jgi:hypothetical protein
MPMPTFRLPLLLRRGWPALFAGALALALYARTMAPGLTWAHDGADGGDLLAAALTGGIPHPPGYPTYELLLRAAVGVLPGSPARAGNWFSALCAAASAALLADLARRLLAQHGQPRWAGVIALGVGLAWAASPALWSQAVITEVYTLHALFVTLLLWLLWRGREEVGSSPALWLVLAGLVWGIGLGNHLSLALMLPAAAVWWWTSRGGHAADGRSVRPRGEVVLPAVGAAVGLAVYAYLPLAASGRPSINWGNPGTPASFWWVVSARLYGQMVFGLHAASFPARCLAWAAQALGQFGPWGAALAVLGLWRLEAVDWGLWRLTGLVAVLYAAFAIGYNTADSYIYLLPVWAVAALWLAVGVDTLGTFLVSREGVSPANGTEPNPQPLLQFLAVLLLALALPAVSVARNYAAMDVSDDLAAETFMRTALATAAPDAVILVAKDQPTFALWYGVYGLRLRADVIPLNVNLYGFDWYRATLADHHPAAAATLDAAPVDGRAAPDFNVLLTHLARGAPSHPLYRAGDIGLTLEGFAERPTGALVELVPK